MTENLILDTDSYKASHFLQYPPGTTSMFAYFESRGGDYRSVLFFGLQYILRRYLSRQVTREMVDEAAEFFVEHGEPFPYEGWLHIVDEWEGHIPVRIRAVPEGTLVPNRNVLFTVEATDPKVFWIVSWIETMLVRVWYPCTVATKSHAIRQVIKQYLEMTSDIRDPDNIAFKLHDFGARGVSSRESAGIGGMAHLVNFKGSDNVPGVQYANKYYHSDMAAFSIPAAEHSTITAWGRDREEDAYRNMLYNFQKGGMVAIVSDSYDIKNAVQNIWGDKLRQEVIDGGGLVIIRPDSGDPPAMVLGVTDDLADKFGYKTNSQGRGYKVLEHVRVMQGDGIDDEASVGAILERLEHYNYSADNVTFGMGGGLLQKVNRDTQQFAYKCSSVTINDQMVDVQKTTPGKGSKPGRLDLVRRGSRLQTVPLFWGQVESSDTVMATVFLNGECALDQVLADIRFRANPELR